MVRDSLERGVLMRRLGLVLVLLLAGILSIPGIAVANESPLPEYHRDKYPAWMLSLARDAVARNFPHCTPREKEQAVQETLAFYHVVWHTTKFHHLERNIALTKAYERQIREACLRYGVPPQMALSIITWENSGSVQAESWAACVGLGQMSDGAVYQAHRYYKRASRDLTAAAALFELLADVCKGLFKSSHAVEYLLRATARNIREQASLIDLDKRHAKLRKAAGVKDERLVPECNIEDSVVFMKLLLDLYGNRIDLAISAYHNGQGNNDDLLRDYLRRVDPQAATFTATHRAPLVKAIRERNISFLTLWNDRRCREMLNGLRTMDGEVTTDANRSEALGDESDIYVWKCTGALAGLLASDAHIAMLLDRYRAEHDVAETSGFRHGGKRVTVAKGVQVAPELAGYLDALKHRYKSLTGRPLTVQLAASHAHLTHDEGIAVDVVSGGGPALAALLYEDWLFDRIYRRRLDNGHLHVVLNPRFGAEYLKQAVGAHSFNSR